MHNFDDLQKRCKKYRVKQFLKYLLIVLLPLIALALYLSWITEKKPPLKDKVFVKNTLKKQPKQDTKREKLQTKIVQKKRLSQSTKAPKAVNATIKKYYLQFLVTSKNHMTQIKRKKRLLESIGFKECKLIQPVVYIHLVCHESNSLEGLASSIELAKKNHLDYYVLVRDNTQETIKTPKKEIKKKEQKKEIEKSSTSMVKVQNTNIKQLQNKFSQKPSYNIAMILARSYYKKEAFKDAIVWAKKANEIDKSDAESWIVYAKSLYALGQGSKARELLHIYLQYETSEEVDTLLKKWEQDQ